MHKSVAKSSRIFIEPISKAKRIPSQLFVGVRLKTPLDFIRSPFVFIPLCLIKNGKPLSIPLGQIYLLLSILFSSSSPASSLPQPIPRTRSARLVPLHLRPKSSRPGRGPKGRQRPLHPNPREQPLPTPTLGRRRQRQDGEHPRARVYPSTSAFVPMRATRPIMGTDAQQQPCSPEALALANKSSSSRSPFFFPAASPQLLPLCFLHQRRRATPSTAAPSCTRRRPQPRPRPRA